MLIECESNADGRLSVDGALYAAHVVYGKGCTSQEGTVTQLWGVETTNVSFFVNDAPVSTDVSADTVYAGDYLVASVDQDTANDYDKYCRFNVLETTTKAGEAFVLILNDDTGNALAGMEIGLSNGNGSTTMTVLTTDVNGSVTLTLDQGGLYCVTAKGTVVESSIDVNTLEVTSFASPIVAPVCVVTVSGVASQQPAVWSSVTTIFTEQDTAVPYTAIDPANSITENFCVILALTAIGKDVTDVGGYNLLNGLDEMAYIQNQGINGTIWALIAFDCHNYEMPAGDVTREKLINVILNEQRSDGGWALSGATSDPDVTGMALQALAP